MTRRLRPLLAVTAATALLSGCAFQPGVTDLPSAQTTGPSMTRHHIDTVVQRLGADLVTLPTTTGAAADARRAEVFSGMALKAAQAQATVGTAGKGAELENPFATSSDLQVQAVSGGLGYPRSLLLLAGGDGKGLPVLHVAQEKDVTSPFRVVASVRLLPGITVDSFPGPGAGTAFTAPQGLVVQPDELASEYAASLRFPKPGPAVPELTPDVYRASVTKAASDQAVSLSSLASYTETYSAVPDSTVSVTQTSGSALVLTALRRSTKISVKAGHRVATPKVFQAFDHGQQYLTSSGSVDTLVLLAFQVPRFAGKAELVGASEQVLAASGS